MHNDIQHPLILQINKFFFILSFIIYIISFNTYSNIQENSKNIEQIFDLPTRDKIAQLEQEIQKIKNTQKHFIKNQKESNDNIQQTSNLTQTLEISGFFDVKAHANNSDGQPFELGALEMGIQYDKIKNVAVSAALVWDGDEAAVGVAVLDYHVGTHNVPSRGKLFGEAGYHIQLGRFDIPFGVDYEYFAAPDRTNITAPLTTDLIQDGGFNSDGIRAYGTWSQFDYAFYWTNSVFENTGTTIGSRIGIFPSRDPYSIHNRSSQNNIVLGVSWLHDMDENQNKRSEMYAVDFSWQYEFIGLITEYISIDRIDSKTFIKTTRDNGYNIRFTFDFDPLSLYLGYGKWQQDFFNHATFIEQIDNTLNRATIAVNYVIADYLQIKLEYLTHIDSVPQNIDFEKNTLTFQLVANF